VSETLVGLGYNWIMVDNKKIKITYLQPLTYTKKEVPPVLCKIVEEEAKQIVRRAVNTWMYSDVKAS
jgi:hypothetical protein